MKLHLKNIGLLFALGTLHSLFSLNMFSSGELSAKAQGLYNDEQDDDLEIDPVPITASWLKYGFDPRGPSFAQNNTPKLFSYSLEGGVGYRNDQYHWIVFIPEDSVPKNVDSKIKYTNIVQVELLAKIYIGNLFFSLNGDWGHICSGKDSTKVTNVVPSPNPSASFHSGVHGHVEDYAVNLGYYLKLYSGQKNRFYLTPQVGYQWNFQHYTDTHIKPKSTLTDPSESNDITDLHLSYQKSSPKLRWEGPFVGLSLYFQLQRVDLEFGGTYEWLEEHFDNKINPILTGNMGGASIQANTKSHFRGGFHTQYAYSGFLKLNYHLSSHWLLGFNASYRQAKVDDGVLKDTIVIDLYEGGQHQQIVNKVVSQPSTNRWDSWTAGITAAYIF